MLRKRSRPVSSKQAIVADQSNQQAWLVNEKPTKTSSFFFNSPRIFKGLFTVTSPTTPENTEPPPMMSSPTSILDTKPFSAFTNSFWVEKKPPNKMLEKQHSWEQPNNTKGIGVALVDDENLENNVIMNNNSNNNSPSSKQQKRKLVVFGSQLRIQVPQLQSSSVFPCFSPESPREFGIKTPRAHLNPFGNKGSQVHPEKNTGMLSENIPLSDIEQSEDYTCVISHGPNPKTTHIYGNCIVESCCGFNGGSSSFSSRRNGYLSPLGNLSPSPENFLSFCHHCKKKLGQGKDIYMYRGEKAFCSEECRCQEMLFDGLES